MAEIVLRLCPGKGHPRTTAPRSLESFPISTVLGKDSIARIAPADTAIGRPTATARRLVNASVSDNTRRAYAGALGQRDGWLGGHRLDDAALAAYLAELHDAGCAASSAAMAVAAARFRAQAPRPAWRTPDMPCSAPFHLDDHGAAGPHLERLRVAVVKSCGPVDVGCSRTGSTVLAANSGGPAGPRRRPRTTFDQGVKPRLRQDSFSRSKKGWPLLVGRSSAFTHIGGAYRAAGFLPIAMPVQCTELDRRRRLRPSPSPDFCHRLLGAPTRRGPSARCR